MTPTARTLQRLRRDGWVAAVCESWIPRLERRRDLFGIGDVVAFRDGAALLVQCTSRGHVGDRVKRIQGRPDLAALLRARVRVEVWGWDGRTVKVVAVGMDDVAVLVQPRRRRPDPQRSLFEEEGSTAPRPPGREE